MSEHPSRTPQLRAALGRNRLLHEVLNDDAAALRDAVVRRRCHEEMRVVVAARRRWFSLIAAAMVLMAISVTLPLMLPSSPSPSVPTHQQMSALPTSTPVDDGRFIIVHTPTAKSEGVRLVTAVSGPSLLITLPTSSTTPHMLRIATADAGPGFRSISLQPSLVVSHTATIQLGYQVMTTANQHIVVPTITDDELLDLPGIVALYKIAPGQSRALFSSGQ